MSSLTKFLDGKKSYLGAVAWGVLGFAHSMGWVTDTVYSIGVPLVQSWFGFGVAHKLAKGFKK